MNFNYIKKQLLNIEFPIYCNNNNLDNVLLNSVITTSSSNAIHIKIVDKIYHLYTFNNCYESTGRDILFLTSPTNLFIFTDCCTLELTIDEKKKRGLYFLNFFNTSNIKRYYIPIIVNIPCNNELSELKSDGYSHIVKTVLICLKRKMPKVLILMILKKSKEMMMKFTINNSILKIITI